MKRVTERKGTTPEVPSCIGTFFLDSGAFSLYTKLVLKRDPKDRGPSGYDSPEFWEYVDRYAAFIHEHKQAVDYYANVDAIGDAKTTWKVQKYLERKHHLRPIPVIHFGGDHKWISFYMERGYDLIAFGGLARRHLVGKDIYHEWLDRAFDMICPSSNDRLPLVKVHGFAVTNYKLLVRYPWWSVDSASWVKAGGYGTIYVPRLKNGAFVFSHVKNEERVPIYPYSISVSDKSPSKKVVNQSIHSIPRKAQKVVQMWLDKVEVPLGSVDKDGEMKEWGVVSAHAARKIVNLKFFEAMANSLPEWPWAFKGSPRSTFLESV